MNVILRLVNKTGEIQEHIVKMDVRPCQGDYINWQRPTLLVFTAQIDRHVRTIDPNWAGEYKVGRIEHHFDDHSSVVVWAEKT